MYETIRYSLLWYALCINLVAAGLAFYDKRMAIRHRRRVPEKTLLGIAFAGGALGEWLMMLRVHHKTKHMKFMILLPLFTLMHIGAVIFILLR